MTDLLLPCPFCGCKEIESLFVIDVEDTDSPYAWVECTNCHAGISDFDINAYETVINKWNTRHEFA